MFFPPPSISPNPNPSGLNCPQGTTVPASLADSQAAKDSDWGICGRGQKTSAPNWTSAAQPVAAPVSSFVYRSFHEPVGGFIAVSSIRTSLLSAAEMAHCPPPDI